MKHSEKTSLATMFLTLFFAIAFLSLLGYMFVATALEYHRDATKNWKYVIKTESYTYHCDTQKEYPNGQIWFSDCWGNQEGYVFNKNNFILE